MLHQFKSILPVLKKEGVISVARGAGGARLNKEPEQLTVWDVYNALEPDGLEHFIGLHPSPSDKYPVGRQMHSVLKTTYQEISNAVEHKDFLLYSL